MVSDSKQVKILIGEIPEESGCAAHLVSNDQPPFARPFDFEDFDNGAISRLNVPHDLKHAKNASVRANG
jgi:hypothetical protein